jgi:hypothetical protein
MKTLTRYINNRKVEISIRTVDKGARIGVSVSLGWVKKEAEKSYYTISHTIYQDFQKFYLVTDRPKRLTEKFKSDLLNKLDLSLVISDIANHYKSEVKDSAD